MRAWVSVLLIVAMLLGVTPPVLAACSGSSPNLVAATWADVALCHTAAANGDTITVTATSDTATTQTTITKYVTLDFSATTALTDNTSVGQTTTVSLLDITESSAGNTKVIIGKVIQGTAIHSSPVALVTVRAAVGGKPFLATGTNGLTSYQTTSSAGDFFNVKTNRGVFWNLRMTGTPAGGNCGNNNSFMRMDPADSSFTTTRPYGNADTNGDKWVYVEGNTITDANEGLDLNGDGRMVIRFNTLKASAIEVHGDTSFGGCCAEIYKNTFQTDLTLQAGCTPPGVLIMNMQAFITFRAGTAKIIDNTIPALDLSPFWGVKDPIQFHEAKVRRNSGPWPCWVGMPASNPGGTISYPSPRNVGWGWSTGATTVGGAGYSGGAVTQDLEPVYLAGNSGGGNYDVPALVSYACNIAPSGSEGSCDYPDTAACALRANVTDYIQSDRDYYRQPASFTGASGTGAGARASRPATCTTGTAWWATDQGTWNSSGSSGGGSGQQGVLDVCTSANTWTNARYVPYAYPHFLAAGGSSPAPPVGTTTTAIGGAGSLGGGAQIR